MEEKTYSVFYQKNLSNDNSIYKEYKYHDYTKAFTKYDQCISEGRHLEPFKYSGFCVSLNYNESSKVHKQIAQCVYDFDVFLNSIGFKFKEEK